MFGFNLQYLRKLNPLAHYFHPSTQVVSTFLLTVSVRDSPSEVLFFISCVPVFATRGILPLGFIYQPRPLKSFSYGSCPGFAILINRPSWLRSQIRNMRFFSVRVVIISLYHWLSFCFPTTPAPPPYLLLFVTDLIHQYLCYFLYKDTTSLCLLGSSYPRWRSATRAIRYIFFALPITIHLFTEISLVSHQVVREPVVLHCTT